MEKAVRSTTIVGHCMMYVATCVGPNMELCTRKPVCEGILISTRL